MAAYNWGSFLPGGIPFRYDPNNPTASNIFGTTYDTSTWQPTETNPARNVSLGKGLAQDTKEKVMDRTDLINKRANELGYIDTSKPQVNKMSMFPDMSNVNWRGNIFQGDARGYGNTTQNIDPNWQTSAGSVGHWNYKPTLPVTGTNYPGANKPVQEIVNEDIHLDVGPQRPIITPNIPKPGADWPGFGIPRALAETVFRMKEGPYYSEKFPGREFTEGGKTYTQSGLGGYYHPDEVFNMQQFGGVGTFDPRKDKWDKNIVSFADDWEEGLEDWVGKYGDMKYKTERMRKKQADKIAMLEQIQNRRAAIEAANRAASAQHLASQGIQVGGGGRWEDPGQRDRGGQGAFREDVKSMRSAGRSYKDAQGNVGYSRGRKDGGRVGLYAGGDPEEPAENIYEFMQDQGVPYGDMASAVDPMDALNDMSMNIFGKPLHELTGEEYQMLIDMANDQASGPQEEIVEEGIASLV
jgi:hypothetical protein